MLLETVIATGLLIVGLAVVGAQVQSAVTSVRMMDRRARAIVLAEVQLAELSMGLIELDSVDAEQEEEFGPGHPDFAWRLTIDDTAVEDLFQLKLEVLYQPREGIEETFDFDDAEVLHTVYAMRVAPRELDIGAVFALSDDELAQVVEALEESECDCLASLDESLQLDLPCWVGLLPEELLKCYETLQGIPGFDLAGASQALPPGYQDMFQDMLDRALGGSSDSDNEDGSEGAGGQ
ncbi:MAG: hypothetical protein IID43_01695 [Planctomycetes bacterium]|nr:hypothetical protein [Planctomycetota bacterium]